MLYICTQEVLLYGNKLHPVSRILSFVTIFIVVLSFVCLMDLCIAVCTSLSKDDCPLLLSTA